MELKQVFLTRNYNGDLTGSVEFSNELGTIKLNMDPEASQEILRVCGDALVRISKKAADEMTAKVIEAITIKRITP